MKSASKFVSAQCALLAALGIVAGGSAPAFAADLGGNCCADLEERIAELEATTARKGNRKVSLTISGWVNEAVFWWDDGVESNIYEGTNDLERSRFRFVGKAKINSDLSAGYTLEIGVRGANSAKFSQDSTGTTSAVDVRKTSWFLQSETYGKLTVGQDGTATYHLLDDADITQTRNFSDAEAAAVAMGAFKVRIGGVAPGLLWTDFLRGGNNSTPGQSGRRDIVRYDTPVFQGFSASAAWGEDDIWDAAVTYKGEFADFKLALKAGYGHNADEGVETCHSGPVQADCEHWGVAGTVMHIPTGLYVYAGYGEQQDNTRTLVAATADDTDTTWIVQGGIEQKFWEIGKTTLFGEYRQDDAGSNPGKTLGGSFIHDSQIKFAAGGVVQSIDAAAMQLYVIYRHAEGETTNDAGASANLDDFDMIISGAMIQF